MAKEQQLWEDAPAKRVARSWQTPGTGVHRGCKSMLSSHDIYQCWWKEFGKNPQIPRRRKKSPRGKSRVWFGLLPVKRGVPLKGDLIEGPSWGALAEPSRTRSLWQRTTPLPETMPEQPVSARQPSQGRLVLDTEKSPSGKDIRITTKWKLKPDVFKQRIRQIFLRMKAFSLGG